MDRFRLINRLRDYLGDKDERIVANDRFINTVMLWILLIGILLSIFYKFAANHIATTNGIETLPYPFDFGDWILIGVLFIAGITELTMYGLYGFFEARVRFADSKSFPLKYYGAICLVVSICMFAASCLIMCIAEWQVIGIDSINWLDNFAFSIVLASCLWVVSVLYAYVLYKFNKYFNN